MHLPMAPGATMPGADAPRQPMPIACDEKRSLPDARRAVAERTPKGNKNALKHGRYTAQAMERRPHRDCRAPDHAI